MRNNDEIMDILESKKTEKDISISEIARQMGMAKSAISRYFNRTREFPLNRIEDISRILGLDSKYVLGFSDNENISTIYNQLNNERQKKVYDFADLQLKQQNGELEQNNILIAAHSKEDLTDDERQQINDFIDKIRKEKRK